MSSLNYCIKENELDSNFTHVDDELDNPFARIQCRGRVIIPTACDGTCRNCGLERSIYLASEIQRMLTEALANPNIGNSLEHEEPPSFEDCQKIVEARMSSFKKKKDVIIIARQNLEANAGERLKLVGKMAKSLPGNKTLN